MKNILCIFLIGITISAFTQTTVKSNKTTGTAKTILQSQTKTAKHKVTFIELGSVRCIPCQKMQPIMKSIEKKFGDRVKVVFHDIWTPAGKPFADIFKVQIIPTQVFLDENGKEFYRHEGLFPEVEIEKLLKTEGIE